MENTQKISFLIILGLLFLLPIFFVPGGALDLSSVKSALLVFGIVAASLAFLYETWRSGTVSLPKHYFLVTAALLPVVYLLSALLSTPSSLSLLGYNLEVGTFGFILLGSTLLILISIIFSQTARALQLLAVFFATFSIIALFTTFKILTGGDILVLGNFSGNMGNPIGNWTDLAVVFGLLSIFVALVLGMIPMKRSIKVLLYAVFGLATVLLVVINFSVAFMLTLGASILLFFYFSKLESHYLHSGKAEKVEGLEKKSGGIFSRPVFLPIVLGVVSLIFLINPPVSGTQKLNNFVADTFNIQNTDVRPTLSATLSISKAVLSEGAFLGSGPNTFGLDWLVFKPVGVNATPFWGVAFPFGIGFVPTQIATTGILGSTLWLVFFAFFVALIIRALTRIPESRAERFALMSSILISLFIWVASFIYAPSATVLILGFIFSGLLVATALSSGIIAKRTISSTDSPQMRFVSTIVLGLLVLGVVALGWFGFNKTASAFHFQKAIKLSNITDASLEEIEGELNKAAKLAPVDAHYIAISRVNFTKAQSAANATEGTPEENKAAFEDALAKTVQAARTAVNVNPASYSNWIFLGQVYTSLVPAPLQIPGAYENAVFAYNEAHKRNPNNPELPLLLAQLELGAGKIEEARSYIRNSIALKEDYAEAYLALARLEIGDNNIVGAIASAERLAQLSTNNPGIHFELGLLKYSNGDYQGAFEAFARAVTLAPEYANAKYYLGLTFARLGNVVEARKQFEELLVTNPGNAELQAALNGLSGAR